MFSFDQPTYSRKMGEILAKDYSRLELQSVKRMSKSCRNVGCVTCLEFQYLKSSCREYGLHKDMF